MVMHKPTESLIIHRLIWQSGSSKLFDMGKASKRLLQQLYNKRTVYELGINATITDTDLHHIFT